jgi:hypothetical protein
MSDYFRELLAEERAESGKKLGDMAYLIGWHGSVAERSGNAELAKLVREMTEVLDGTWQRPEVIR